jgi:RNA recognition motif-containing protein
MKGYKKKLTGHNGSDRVGSHPVGHYGTPPTTRVTKHSNSVVPTVPKDVTSLLGDIPDFVPDYMQYPQEAYYGTPPQPLISPHVFQPVIVDNGGSPISTNIAPLNHSGVSSLAHPTPTRYIASPQVSGCGPHAQLTKHRFNHDRSAFREPHNNGVYVYPVPFMDSINGSIGPGPSIVFGNQIRGTYGCNLFCFHLPNEMTNWDLYLLSRRFGNVLSVHIMINKQTGLSRGFGFISYESKESALNAINGLNGLRLGIKRLKVQLKRDQIDDTSLQDDNDSTDQYDTALDQTDIKDFYFKYNEYNEFQAYDEVEDYQALNKSLGRSYDEVDELSPKPALSTEAGVQLNFSSLELKELNASNEKMVKHSQAETTEFFAKTKSQSESEEKMEYPDY